MPLVVKALAHWGVNVLALLVADWVFDSVAVERWGPLVAAGAVLGLANLILKPIVTVLALPLIVLTLGVAYLLVNVLMLVLTEWVVSDFSIHGFWTYVGATIVVWLVNVVVGSAVGLRGHGAEFRHA